MIVKMKNPHQVRERELQKVDEYQGRQQNLKRNIESLQENLYKNFKHFSGKVCYDMIYVDCLYNHVL